MRQFILIAIGILSSTAVGQDFNWKLLEGRWAESTKNDFGCRPDKLHQTFVLSSDRKILTFKNDRPWNIGSNGEITEYTATILRAEGNSIFIKYGPELRDIPAEFQEWEMRFIGPGTYRWRPLAWGADEYNGVIGVKCAQ